MANGLTPGAAARQLGVVDAVNAHLARRSACSRASRSTSSTTARSTRTDELLAELDVVVASVHSKLRMDRPAMTRRMLAAVANPHTDVLGALHRAAGDPAAAARGRAVAVRRQRVFAACAEHGVAVEIN